MALHTKLANGGLPVSVQSKGILAAREILSGQGTALNVGPSNLLALLYKMLETLPR